MPIKRREIRESAFLLIFEKMFRQDEELDDILFCASECKNIRVRGLMTIAPLYVKNVTAMLHFDNTRKLYIDRKENKYDNEQFFKKYGTFLKFISSYLI